MIGGADSAPRRSPSPTGPPRTNSKSPAQQPAPALPNANNVVNPAVSRTSSSASHRPPSVGPYHQPPVGEYAHGPPPSMSHRVDPYPMPAHRRASYHSVDGRPSPPPIATLNNHSPSPSVSQHNSPAMHPRNSLPAMPYYDGRQQAPPPPLQHQFAHPGHYPDGGYGMPPPGMPPQMARPTMPPPPGRSYGEMTFPGSQTGLPVIHTDDAATKLSDRVRRRCFNCCTTDTSTWRRSNLSPGKVLCNKCGLFERTHSRPRPEQFPHKRGPLASSALASRPPPAGRSNSTSNGHHQPSAPAPNGSPLPPPPPSMSNGHSAPPAPQGAPPQQIGEGSQLPPMQSTHGPGPYYTNPVIPNINDPKDHKPLPDIGSWADRAPAATQETNGRTENATPPQQRPPSSNSKKDESVTLPSIQGMQEGVTA